MRLILLLTGVLLLLGATEAYGAGAANEETGSIAGRVVNGTSGGGSVAGLEVVLEGVKHSTEATMLPPQTTRTDDQGTFRFDGLEVSSENSYLVSVTYENVEYGSRDVTLTPEASTAELEMPVYEPTTSDDAIRVTLDHIVVEADAEARVLRVLEVIDVVNDGDRAYIGEDENSGLQPTIHVPLPEGATAMQVLDGTAPQDLMATAAGFAETTPLVPGTREITPTYDIPYYEPDLLFRKTLAYPTDRLAILVRDEGLTLEASTLSAPEPTQMGDQHYLLVAGDSLAEGTPVEFWLRGLPTAGTDGNGTDTLLPVVGAGVVAAVGIAVFYPLLRRRMRRGQAGSGQHPSLED